MDGSTYLNGAKVRRCDQRNPHHPKKQFNSIEVIKTGLTTTSVITYIHK